MTHPKTNNIDLEPSQIRLKATIQKIREEEYGRKLKKIIGSNTDDLHRIFNLRKIYS